MNSPYARHLAVIKKLLPGEIKLAPATLKQYAGDKWFATHLPDAVALPRSTKSVGHIQRINRVFAGQRGEQRVQPLGATRDEPQHGPAGSVVARKRSTDAAGGTGNENTQGHGGRK